MPRMQNERGDVPSFGVSAKKPTPAKPILSESERFIVAVALLAFLGGVAVTAEVAYQSARVAIDLAPAATHLVPVATHQSEAVQAKETLGWLAAALEGASVLAALLVWAALHRFRWGRTMNTPATILLGALCIGLSVAFGVLQSPGVAGVVLWLSVFCVVLYKGFAGRAESAAAKQ
jgi:hypothetical protein